MEDIALHESPHTGWCVLGSDTGVRCLRGTTTPGHGSAFMCNLFAVSVAQNVPSQSCVDEEAVRPDESKLVGMKQLASAYRGSECTLHNKDAQRRKEPGGQPMTTIGLDLHKRESQLCIGFEE